MVEIPAGRSANLDGKTIYVDTNVVLNLMRSALDDTGLNFLTSGSNRTIVLTDVIEAEIRRKLSNDEWSSYLAWRYDPANFDMILNPETGLPAGRNQGEESIILDIQTDPSLQPENTIILSGDGTGDDPNDGWQADAPNGITIMNTVETVNSLMISGGISYAEYVALIPALTSQVPRTELFNENGVPIYFLPGATYVIGGVEVQFRPNGVIVDGQFRSMTEKFSISGGEVEFPSCFGAGTPVDMWPLDPEFAPDPNNPVKQYDQEAVRAKIWKKPIELIRVGDYVVSHDKNGNMVQGYVPRTMTNDAKIVLDFHGTRVTPGHVYYRPDSKQADKYETLIDILRDDGMIERRDGAKLRAATYAPVDGPLDTFVKAVAGPVMPNGGVDIQERGRIRLGTRFIVDGNRSYSVADLIDAAGGIVGDDELVRMGDGPGMPFHWDFGDTLPKPEGFVLACSGTTLEDIYKAAEWEDQHPRLPAPVIPDVGPVRPLPEGARAKMPRNEPLKLDPGPLSGLNRKQRKAMEALSRKAPTRRNRSLH